MDNYENNFDFKSEVIIDKNTYYSIADIYFCKIYKAYIMLFVIDLLLVTVQMLYNSSFNFITALCGLSLFVCAIKYFKGIKLPKISYQKSVFAKNVASYKETVTFSDKIIFESELSLPTEFFYNSVRYILENKSFYLLVLEHNLCIVVNKTPTSNLENVNYIEYLFSKCHNLKSYKIEKLDKQKKICLAMLILTAVVFLISLFAPSVVEFIKSMPIE